MFESSAPVTELLISGIFPLHWLTSQVINNENLIL